MAMKSLTLSRPVVQPLKSRVALKSLGSARCCMLSTRTPSLATYHDLLQSASSAGLALEAWAILDDMLLTSVQPTARTSYYLARALRYKDSSYLGKIEGKLDRFNTSHDATLISLKIIRFIRDKNIEMALHHLSIARNLNVSPAKAVVNTVVQLAAELGQPRLAVQLAIMYGIQPTESGNALVWMSCLRSCAEHFYDEGVLACWDAMKSLYLYPDEGLCSLLLDLAARFELSSLARQILQRMQELGYNSENSIDLFQFKPSRD